MSWKTIESRTLVEDYHASVKKNKVELTDGAAMVAAVTEDNYIY